MPKPEQPNLFDWANTLGPKKRNRRFHAKRKAPLKQNGITLIHALDGHRGGKKYSRTSRGRDINIHRNRCWFLLFFISMIGYMVYHLLFT